MFGLAATGAIIGIIILSCRYCYCCESCYAAAWHLRRNATDRSTIEPRGVFLLYIILYALCIIVIIVIIIIFLCIYCILLYYPYCAVAGARLAKWYITCACNAHRARLASLTPTTLAGSLYIYTITTLYSHSRLDNTICRLLYIVYYQLLYIYTGNSWSNNIWSSSTIFFHHHFFIL